MSNDRIGRVGLMGLGKHLESHVPVHRPRTEHSKAITKQFHLHGRRRRVVAMRDPVVDHLRDNLLVNLEGVVRLCAKCMPADAKIELLLDEFNRLVGDFEKVALKPFV